MIATDRQQHQPDIGAWMKEKDADVLEALFARAREVRNRHFGKQVHLRGLLDFSNLCVRQCTYCGIRAGNSRVSRYLMNQEEILACAAAAKRMGYGTIVLQAGEDERITAQGVADMVVAIRDRFDLAVTLSLGERSPEAYWLWKRSGADRYLLKIETSDPDLFGRIHPPRIKDAPGRIDHLMSLRAMGYEIGSGIMVGLPGQALDSLVRDLRVFQELDLDMIAIGPYLPHPETPLGRVFLSRRLNTTGQVENSDTMTCKVIALARLLCPQANIPATTALSCLTDRGYLRGLNAGANVIMPNLTPPEHELHYDIYPKQRPVSRSNIHNAIVDQIASASLTLGSGRGGRLKERNDNAEEYELRCHHLTG